MTDQNKRPETDDDLKARYIPAKRRCLGCGRAFGMSWPSHMRHMRETRRVR